MMKKYASLIGLLGLLSIFIGLVVYSIYTKINIAVGVLLGLGLVLLIAFVILRFEAIKTGLSSRSAKFGSNAAMMILLLLGILVVINIFANRFSYRYDATAAKVFSLSEQTRKVLKNLKADVKVIGFFKSGEEKQLSELLTEYGHFSQRLSYEFIDPDKKPVEAKRYGIKSYNTIVVECRDKQEKINTVSEQELTNAIIKVTREGVKKIYFTTGHGEKDYENTQQDGLSKAKAAIDELNYQVEKILLIQPPDSIPSDCALLIIAGPRTDLLPPERNKIDAYLKRGGKLLMMLDPESPASYGELAAQYGIRVDDNFIVELSPVGQLFGAGPIMPIVTNYEKHTISEGFQGMMTLFSEARSVSRKDDVSGDVTVTEIAKTSSSSWGETTPLRMGAQVGYNPGVDQMGPLSILTVAEKAAEKPTAVNDQYNLGLGEVKTRLAVFGDSDFAMNGYFNFQANGNLFMNVLNWLAEEEDLVSIRPRDPENRRLNLTAQQSKLMLWVGVILLPLACFGTGVYVYTKRRK
ncbi:MAG: GldG family protein [candidate division KSB1 bacterium]|nr:GldG family protein [candidate division KSB1 bacterium]